MRQPRIGEIFRTASEQSAARIRINKTNFNFPGLLYKLTKKFKELTNLSFSNKVPPPSRVYV